MSRMGFGPCIPQQAAPSGPITRVAKGAWAAYSISETFTVSDGSTVVIAVFDPFGAGWCNIDLSGLVGVDVVSGSLPPDGVCLVRCFANLPAGSYSLNLSLQDVWPILAVAVELQNAAGTTPSDAAGNNSGTGTSISASTTGATTQAAEMALAFLIEGTDTGAAGSWGDGFSAGQAITYTGEGFRVSEAYKVLSSTGVVTASKTGLPNSIAKSLLVATFKEA